MSLARSEINTTNISPEGGDMTEQRPEFLWWWCGHCSTISLRPTASPNPRPFHLQSVFDHHSSPLQFLVVHRWWVHLPMNKYISIYISISICRLFITHLSNSNNDQLLLAPRHVWPSIVDVMASPPCPHSNLDWSDLVSVQQHQFLGIGNYTRRIIQYWCANDL